MPTGYTQTLLDHDQSFTDFMLGCARAFDPLGYVQTQDLDVPLPARLTPPAYWTARLALAERQVERLMGMTLDEAAREAESEHRRALAAMNAANGHKLRMQERVRAMLEQAEAWEPGELFGSLKRFAVQQLYDALDECHSLYPTAMFKEPQTGLAWRDLATQDAIAEVARCKDKQAAVLAQYQRAQVYLDKLRQALPTPITFDIESVPGKIAVAHGLPKVAWRESQSVLVDELRYDRSQMDLCEFCPRPSPHHRRTTSHMPGKPMHGVKSKGLA